MTSVTSRTSLGDALEAFIPEHEYCGELDAAVEAERVSPTPERAPRRHSFAQRTMAHGARECAADKDGASVSTARATNSSCSSKDRRRHRMN
jgi:hypothetical protein